MIPVASARAPESLRGRAGCGYRYCHAPHLPVGRGSHTDCQLAESKLYSNSMAAQMNLMRRMMRG